MMQNSYYDDVLSSLVRRVNYLERRLVIAETGEFAGGLTHGVLLGLDADDHPQYAFRDEAVTYVGTPTATYYAVWDGPGTLSASALNTSSFVISQGVLGGQTIAGGDSMSDGPSSTLTVYGTYYNGGTLNPNYDAIKFMPARGLSPSLHTTMYHNGNWTFSRNVNIMGTIYAGNLTGPVLNNIVLTTGDQMVSGAKTWSDNARFNGLVGVNVAPDTGAQVAVVSGAAGRVGLRVDAAPSQTASLQEWRDSSGAVLTAISAAGAIQSSSLLALRCTSGASLANDAVLDTGYSYSLVYVYSSTMGRGALFRVDVDGSVLVSGSSAHYSNTADTASRVNVYYSGGTIKVQNRRGSSVNIRVHMLTA